MDPIKNILVCLDSTATDEDLLRYTRFIINAADKVEKVYIVNVLQNFQLNSEVRKEFPELEKNALSQRKLELKNQIEKYITDKLHLKYELIVKIGRGLKTILKLVDNFNISLVVVGRKTDGTGAGVLTQRLGRRCPCNLMIVPQGSQVRIKPKKKDHVILVATDFSKYSQLAMEAAVQIAYNFKNTRIVCQHVYSVPTGYHYSGKSHDEFGDVMEKNSKKRFKSWINKIDTLGIPIEEVYTLDDNENHVQDIHNLAQKIQPSGIIFGSRGISGSTSFFLGSTAEKLIKIDVDFPLLVIRKPGDTKGLLQVLKKF